MVDQEQSQTTYTFKIEKGKNLIDPRAKAYDAEILGGLIKLPDAYYYFSKATDGKNSLNKSQNISRIKESRDIVNMDELTIELVANSPAIRIGQREMLPVDLRNIFSKRDIVEELKSGQSFTIKPYEYQFPPRSDGEIRSCVAIYDGEEQIGYLSDFGLYSNGDQNESYSCMAVTGLKPEVSNVTIADLFSDGFYIEGGLGHSMTKDHPLLGKYCLANSSPLFKEAEVATNVLSVLQNDNDENREIAKSLAFLFHVDQDNVLNNLKDAFFGGDTLKILRGLKYHYKAFTEIQTLKDKIANMEQTCCDEDKKVLPEIAALREKIANIEQTCCDENKKYTFKVEKGQNIEGDRYHVTTAHGLINLSELTTEKNYYFWKLGNGDFRIFEQLSGSRSFTPIERSYFTIERLPSGYVGYFSQVNGNRLTSDSTRFDLDSNALFADSKMASSVLNFLSAVDNESVRNILPELVFDETVKENLKTRLAKDIDLQDGIARELRENPGNARGPEGPRGLNASPAAVAQKLVTDKVNELQHVIFGTPVPTLEGKTLKDYVVQDMPKDIADISSFRSAMRTEVAAKLQADGDFKESIKGDTGSEGPKGDNADPTEVANALKIDDIFKASIKGDPGPRGPKGDDADPVQVANALKTDSTFKASVKGEKGDDADPVQVANALKTDSTFKVSVKGDPGPRGPKGDDADPVQVANALKTDSTFKASVKGDPGPRGPKGNDADPVQVANALKTDSTFKASVKGDPGPRGPKGNDADPAQVANALKTDSTFEASVKGEKGDAGKDGVDGQNGKDGTSPTPDAVAAALLDSANAPQLGKAVLDAEGGVLSTRVASVLKTDSEFQTIIINESDASTILEEVRKMRGETEGFKTEAEGFKTEAERAKDTAEKAKVFTEGVKQYTEGAVQDISASKLTINALTNDVVKDVLCPLKPDNCRCPDNADKPECASSGRARRHAVDEEELFAMHSDESFYPQTAAFQSDYNGQSPDIGIF